MSLDWNWGDLISGAVGLVLGWLTNVLNTKRKARK